MRHTRFGLLSLAVLSLAACTDGIGPGGPTSEIDVEFCPGVAPTWFAFRNEGGSWVHVNNTNGVFTFPATAKVTVAFVYAADYFAFVDVRSMTAEQIDHLACVVEPPGTKELSGTLAGLEGMNATVKIAGQANHVASGQQAVSYSLHGVRDGAHDLIAIRERHDLTGFVADRMLIRRGMNPPHGGIIPTLDFLGSEAFTPPVNTISVVGIAGDDSPILWNTIHASGTSLEISIQTPTRVSPATVAVPAVPIDLQQDGDLHEVIAATNSSSDVYLARGVSVTYRVPTDLTVPLGPYPVVPTHTTLALYPYMRLRSEVGAEGYSSTAMVQYVQQGRDVRVSISREYMGEAPTTWILEVPDLLGVPGFQAEWGLRAGDYDWAMEVAELPDGFLTGAERADGDVVRAGYAATQALELYRESSKPRLLIAGLPDTAASGRRR